jgi:hypothetical protein
MFRKCTALAFMLVMTLLITLKHPVLGYCLCLDSYFTGDCVCQAEKKSADPTAKQDSPCPSCCSTSEAENNEDIPAPTPCDDCTEHLLVDVGDFVWNVSDDVPSDTETFLLTPTFDLCSVQLPLASLHTTASARGDPPPGQNDGVPIYLRHRVLRL